MHRENALIEADELIAILDKPELRIFDATIMFYMGMSPEEAAKMPTAHQQYLAGHIPGAAFFDHKKYSDLGSPYEYMRAPDDVLADRIGQAGIAANSDVILYTPGILASATRAWWLLRYAGVEQVRVLNGGYKAWLKAGCAVEQQESSYPPARFTGQFNPGMFADKEEVQASINQASTLIENALTQDWYDREHIPGSTCLPLIDLTVGWDAFLPADQLNARLKPVDPHQRIITYCGGGIAATVNALAYLMAGVRQVAVYDGSLFEWKGEGLPLDGSPGA